MIGVSDKFSRKLLCLTVAGVCAGTAVAGPAGPVVSAGNATYAPATLTVTSTTARTRISWQSFNVAANEVVKFVQPNAQSAVLNQVFNAQSLNILGGVNSNGSVLFMSNGIVSGSGLNLDLAGMISTSLRLPRMALAPSGVATPTQPRPLTTLAAGSIYVISQDEQAVTAADGDVLLNPGKTIELAYAAMPNLRVELTAPDAEAINLSRLVGGKRETGIFAGLFRPPAAARQEVQRDADAVLTASAQEHAPNTPDMERFYRYALLYARMRSETLRHEDGMMQVAAASTGGMMLPAVKSRPNLLPRDIEIGAPMARPDEAPVWLASLPVPAAPEQLVATLEPQAIPVAVESESERNAAMLLTLVPALPAAEIVATLEPQPILVRQAQEPEDMRTLASQLAAAQSRAQPALAQVAQPELDPAPSRDKPQSAPTVIVVALAQQGAAPAPREDSNVKEVRIERRAPRYFTDYRGAMFFM